MGRVLVSASHFDTLCQEAWKLLEENGHEVVYDPARAFPAYGTEELRTLLPEIDAAIIGLDQYNEEVLSISPRLKIVSKFGVGVDNIDLDAARERRICATNAPGCNANGVAELTVALIVDLLRGVVRTHTDLTMGQWNRPIDKELKGKTLGLLGFGAIGKLVAKKLSGWDVRILAYDPRMDHAAAENLQVTVCGTAEEVITECNILSLHFPATAENYHMFDQEKFASMKQGAYFINCARGTLMDLDALCAALKSGQLAGAAIDAFEMEPLPKDAEIFSCGNVVCLPHIGAETEDAYRNVSMCVAQDVIRVLRGEPPHCWANPW